MMNDRDRVRWLGGAGAHGKERKGKKNHVRARWRPGASVRRFWPSRVLVERDWAFFFLLPQWGHRPTGRRAVRFPFVCFLLLLLLLLLLRDACVASRSLIVTQARCRMQCIIYPPT